MRVDPILVPNLSETVHELDIGSDNGLPVSITKAASQQTYYTIRFLADQDRVGDAYRAYAYFRWVDDRLDGELTDRSERIAFLECQQMLVERCYYREPVYHLLPQEEMLVRLIRADNEEHSGLQAYIRNMMAVMAFDTYRRGQLITQVELADYSCSLATGVMEALHYFIGHNDPLPPDEGRYLAVTGAHITHMLRDTFEDVDAGYFNISREFLNAHRLDPCDLQNQAYREWVESRVRLARHYFEAGKRYLAQVRSRRCRLAGYAYIARFEGVLDAIEREDFCLRAQYLERKSIRGGLKMGWSALSMLLNPSIRGVL
jgi:phytoene/squalene synthetase